MALSWNSKDEKKIAEEVTFSEFDTSKRINSIDTPPPYPSGRPWHIGAAAHYSQIDMLARTMRMQGKNVFFPIGIDRNGLPVERYTEKKFNINMHQMPREKFIELCSHALDDLEAEMLSIMKSMGLSGDFKNYYRTDSKEYRALTQSTFIELWNKGLIYEDRRPNNYCISCGTTIADAEIVYEELPTELVYIKFKLKQGKLKSKRESGEIIIATTRPELICACQVVLCNPKDERYAKIIDKEIKVELPLYKREVPFATHSSVEKEFGTGVVMMCSYGDYTDVRIFRELGLKEIAAIDEKGLMTKEAGKYAGMRIKDARKAIIEDLDKARLIVKKEKIMHRTPVCERCNTPTEIISMPEFYLKQLNFIDDIKKIIDKAVFYPKIHKQLLLDWINSITIDWPISRRRYYGTEIPIWRCKKCKNILLPKADYKTYWQPWRQKFPGKCECGGELVGDERTFDTWMDSSVSPLFISKFKKDDNFFSKAFPCEIRPQGKEIVRTWLYYTLLRCYQLTGEPAFNKIWIMGLGVDEKGEKMSKSKGNVIDPIPMLEKYGADAFRFWAASESSLGFDFRCSEQRIISAGKFINKVFNIAKFVSSFGKPAEKPPKLEALDKWILSELNKTSEIVMSGYNEFNFFIPSNELRKFLWNLFADHYLELVKARAYKGDKSALYTLNKCLEVCLILLAPIIPFITYYLFKEIYRKNVHKQKFSEIKIENIKSKLETRCIIESNSAIWKAKKDKRLNLKSEIKEAVLPEKLKIIKKDLIACHNIKNLKFGDKIEIAL